MFSNYNFQSMQDFSLKWRWTEESQTKLKDEDLVRIKPLTPESAELLWNRSLKFLNSTQGRDFSPSQKFFKNIESLNEPQLYLKTQNWLMSKFENEDQSSINIGISWSKSLAVLTNLQIFIQNWDSFCYQSSDDVTIFPDSENWVIQYWHIDRFYFADSKV
jgi:hypothetical protein